MDIEEVRTAVFRNEKKKKVADCDFTSITDVASFF